MPTFRTEVGPEEKPFLKAVLHVDGQWGDLDATQKEAFNRATHAINQLCDLYDPDPDPSVQPTRSSE
jgi:hypothetical protein